MKKFKDIPQQVNFSKLEEEIANFWQNGNIVNQYIHLNDHSNMTFSFIDGPITANGPMGVHHARGRTLKDLFQRYKNAKGFRQRFQNGFDCQGLWVEVEVEKEKGFNSKKDIQDFGLDRFTQACLDRVDHFANMQTEQSKRLGMFMDWDNSYYTNSTTNNLYIWHFLKRVHQKGWLTKRKSATTWCPRCETGLSQHEQADGYKDISDTSVYVKFKLLGRDNEYILAWTTTPWTLSANVLLAINTKFDYVKVTHQGETLYLAKLAADRLALHEQVPIDSKTLLNLPYESLYDIPAQSGINHYIVNWDMVDPVNGTGVVHIAPGCGQEDFELGKDLNSDMLAPLDETGHFIDGYGQLSGKYAHDVAPMVFEYLSHTKSLFKQETITHRYPHCWRCKTKCLFRLEDSWYIRSDEIRPLMKEAAKKVDWHPRYVGRRMQNWLDTMDDWMISRKRFYGLALPFYPCDCGHLTVVGSQEELKQLALDPDKVDQIPSFHRPWIDTIKIKCPKCGHEVKRIADVGDCWLDAGVVPFSTLNYLTDKDYWQKWYPADMVLENTEQVRLWFYSMLFFGVTLEESSPYTSVVTYGEVRDEKGERISKTKKNGIQYDDAIPQMGADAMRWLYCQQKSHTNVSFGYSIADNVKKDFMLILWNSYRFFTQHANSDDQQGRDCQITDFTHRPVLDQWIVSRLHSTIKQVTGQLDNCKTSLATKTIESFVLDLSTWYIRRSRTRNDTFEVLYYCFDYLIHILAPFIPFLAEYLYQNLHQDQGSVHLSQWPEFNDDLIKPELELQMSQVRQLCQEIHALRQKHNIKVRQPLHEATINSKIRPDLVEIIKEETNVKNIAFGQSIDIDINLSQDLIDEGLARDLIRNIQVLRQQQKLELSDKIRILTPSWPKKFESEILNRTLAISIESSPETGIVKVE